MEVVHKTVEALKGKSEGKKEFNELLMLLYEIFMVGRRNGLIALEEHVMDPKKSAIFSKYPSVTSNHERLEFMINGLKPVIDGKIKPDQLQDLMTAELDSKATEAEHPLHVLQLVADSLPAIGIVAAVLGIINTMSAISEGPEAVGEKVAAALTGTFLGILGAYGFINPLTSRIGANNVLELQYFNAITKGLSGFVNGMAPLMAAEIARRSLDPCVQPGPDELEKILKGLGK
jgi:chemotaxis protein MotA